MVAGLLRGVLLTVFDAFVVWLDESLTLVIIVLLSRICLRPQGGGTTTPVGKRRRERPGCE
jgi:hypothetical protein